MFEASKLEEAIKELAGELRAEVESAGTQAVTKAEGQATAEAGTLAADVDAARAKVLPVVTEVLERLVAKL